MPAPAVQDAHGRVFDEAFGTALETSLTRSVAVHAAPAALKTTLLSGAETTAIRR